MISSTWQKISLFGVDKKNPDSLFNRSIKLCNRLNIILLVIMFILFVQLRILNYLEGSGFFSIGLGTQRVLYLILLSLINLFLSYLQQHRMAKLSTIFLPPFIAILLPTFLGFVEPESFVYYGFVLVSFSLIPQLLIVPEEEKTLEWISVIYYLLFIYSIEYVLNFFAGKPLRIVEEIKPFFVYFKSVQLLSYFFIVFSVKYLRNINKDFENKLLGANTVLKIQSQELIEKNEKLLDITRELKTKNDKLNEFQEDLCVQNGKLKNTIKILTKTRQTLLHSEKMASLGTLTAGVAHEINNPLNFITGGVHIIEEEFEDLNKKQLLQDSIARKNISRAIEMVHEGMRKINKIIESLKLHSYRGESEKQLVLVEDIMESALLFLNSKIKYRIKVLKDYRFNRPFHVVKDQLHQVFINILDNAVFALLSTGKKNKEIFISTECVSIEGNSLAIVKIFNNGPEIPNDIKDKIFDSFFTTKSPKDGTGLGLSISYKIIKEHGGDIELSNIGGNTGFIVKLPLF